MATTNPTDQNQPTDQRDDAVLPPAASAAATGDGGIDARDAAPAIDEGRDGEPDSPAIDEDNDGELDSLSADAALGDPSMTIPEPPAPAKAAAVQRFKDALKDKGFPEDVASVVALAVVDPAHARRELIAPSQVRVMGGAVLEVIRTDVWAHTVIPYPANPRESGERRLPIQDDDSTVLPHPQPLAGSDCVLVLEAPSRDVVARGQGQSSTLLTSTNSYKSEIREDGVLVPVMAVGLRISHRDGTPDVGALATADGSSRVASCHELLGVSPAAVTYGHAQDARRMHGFVGDIASAVSRIHSGIDEELPAVRALTLPAQIVIGCEGADLRRAIQGYLGMQHVSHPTEWSSAGQIEAKADAALLEMRDEGVPAHVVAWLAGAMRPSEATQLGIVDLLDRRAVEILAYVHDHRSAASRGIRRVDRTILRAKDPKLAEVSAELALRPARGLFSRPREVDVARQSLQEVMQRAFKPDWTSTGRAPEELRDVTLRELEAELQPGPAGYELALLASYWMITRGLVRPLYYSQRLANDQADRRGVHQIVYGMLDTRRGVHQLYRVVVDGRAGIPARTVDGNGKVIPEPKTGRPLRLTNDVLRIHVVPTPSGKPAAPSLPPPGDTPEVQLRSAQFVFQKMVRELVATVDTLASFGPAGSPLVEEYGWPNEVVEEILADLSSIERRLHRWRVVAEMRGQRLHPSVIYSEEAEDGDDGGAVDEVVPLAGGVDDDVDAAADDDGVDGHDDGVDGHDEPVDDQVGVPDDEKDDQGDLGGGSSVRPHTGAGS